MAQTDPSVGFGKEKILFERGLRMRYFRFDYQPMFDQLREKGISRHELSDKYNIPASSITRLKKGQNTSMDMIGRIMEVLGTKDPRNIFEITITADR